MAEYKLLKTEGRAKRAEFHTVHGTIQTPVFMNVGTIGAIKGAVSTMDLQQIGTQVELSNTYHLHVRPGDKIVKQLGGLHKFMVWDKPILTDSGGFQKRGIVLSGDVVDLEYCDHFKLLALVGKLVEAFNAVLIVLLTASADDAHRVCSCRCDGFKGGVVLSCEPGVRVIYPAHDEFVSVCVKELCPADLESGLLSLLVGNFIGFVSSTAICADYLLRRGDNFAGGHGSFRAARAERQSRSKYRC